MADFNFDPVEVPQELRTAMYDAYEALASERAQVDRLKTAHQTVLQEIADAKAALEQQKDCYVASFVDDVSGPNADATKPMEHRDSMAQLASAHGAEHAFLE